MTKNLNKLAMFLEKTYNSLKDLNNFKEFHLVLGNESCDLDSVVSAISYGYYLSQLPSTNTSDIAILPIINTTSDNFQVRKEICHLLQECHIDLAKLIYRSNDQIDTIMKNPKVLLKVYLVDHHVLSTNDEIFLGHVHKIFDHRPVDNTITWTDNVMKRIETVASCATLITDEILKSPGLLFHELAYLLYCTIVYDSLALLPENKKATKLDIEVAEKLENEFNFATNRVELFQKILKLHESIDDLTPEQLLIRDLKFVNNIPIPAIPMLTGDFVKMKGVEEALKKLVEKNKAPFAVLVGIKANKEVKRDISLFIYDEKIASPLVDEFKNHEEFQFATEEIYLTNIVTLRQSNIAMTRKQVIPIVKDYLNKL